MRKPSNSPIVEAWQITRGWSTWLASLSIWLALTGAGLPHYRITLSDSLPRGIYQETQEPLARGVIVAECLPVEWGTLGVERGWIEQGSCPGRTMPLLKQIAGMPGDLVEISEAYVAVNNQLILNTARQEKDSKGRAIPAVELGIFTLKDGEILTLATNSERSWDGRYFGATKVKDVIATLKPVITEKENGL